MTPNRLLLLLSATTDELLTRSLEMAGQSSVAEAAVGTLRFVTTSPGLAGGTSTAQVQAGTLAFFQPAVPRQAGIGKFIYVMNAAPQPPLVTEDGDVLDFADIGGIYDDSSTSAMTSNVSRLNAYFAAESRPAIRFGGPRNAAYGNARSPGTVHLNGTITIPDLKPVIFDGGNCAFVWHTIQGVTPSMTLGQGGAGTERLVSNFQMTTDGSGIACDAPGRGTILRNVRIYPYATGSTAPNYDGWTDRDTAGFGLKVYDGAGVYTPDGLTVENVQIFNSGGHGFLIYDQLHAAQIRGRAHGCMGSGFKAEGLRGCTVDVVSEGNFAWGAHMRNCGMSRYEGGLSGGSSDIPNDLKFWFEINNWRGSAYWVGGHGVRQAKVESTGATRYWGHTGWSSNKIAIDEGSRNSCMFVSAQHVTQSYPPVVDLATSSTHVFPDESSSPASNNFTSVWTDPNDRPSVALIEPVGEDQYFQITWPAGSLDAAVGSVAYWRPWGTESLFTSAAGDVVIYEVEISGDAAMVAWCVGREETSPQRQRSNPVDFHIAPVTGGVVWPGVYNTRKRKLIGRVALDEIRTDVTPAIVVWANGAQDQTGGYPQSSELKLNIHSWKMYVHHKDG